MQVWTATSAQDYQAVAIKPLTERGLRAQDAQLVSLQVNPIHRHFRAFRTIPAPGLMSLDRAAFAPLDTALEAAYRGELTTDDALQLYEAVVETTARHLPKPKPTDARVERAIELLHDDPCYPLDALAARNGLSYGRMSRLFAESVGISLRSYQLWQKTRRALLLLPSGRTLTEIAAETGFTDLSHLSRVLQQAFGAPVSYFQDKRYVKVIKPASFLPPAASSAALPPPSSELPKKSAAR
jgi:AraC-like DNA-binding protein